MRTITAADWFFAYVNSPNLIHLFEEGFVKHRDLAAASGLYFNSKTQMFYRIRDRKEIHEIPLEEIIDLIDKQCAPS